MKTAISIPDADFESAEDLARRLGVSRSKLYAEAVREFVRARRDLGVREALDRVYAAEDSELSEETSAMQSASLPDDDW
ncbi:MAG: hypothetical protein AAF481_00325 [Acidobacteriota bacterium]